MGKKIQSFDHLIQIAQRGMVIKISDPNGFTFTKIRSILVSYYETHGGESVPGLRGDAVLDKYKVHQVNPILATDFGEYTFEIADETEYAGKQFSYEESEAQIERHRKKSL